MFYGGRKKKTTHTQTTTTPPKKGHLLYMEKYSSAVALGWPYIFPRES